MLTGKRKPPACQRCHKKKVKCSGGVPCQNCHSAAVSCVFPIRDRNVVVSEAYIRRLQAESIHAQQHTGIPARSTSVTNSPASAPLPPGHRATPSMTLKNATSEEFVSGLKRLSARDSQGVPTETRHGNGNGGIGSFSEGSDAISNYDYVSLNFDTSTPKATIQLPPYPYAVQLVHQFETFMAYEYHWYLRRQFHSDLETTYRTPDSGRPKNPTWLCKLLAVLALGESFNSYRPPLIDLARNTLRGSGSREGGGDSSSSNGGMPYLPGAHFFDQALCLFKMPSEEPDIEHVEALNLISFFCYSLNRRKTAYMYAGISMRIACTLTLHKPVLSQPPSVAEHRKRVWWTTFLMDVTTSAELGLRATFGSVQAEQQSPSDEQLKPEDLGNFWDAEMMNAHLNLSRVRNQVLETVGGLDDEQSDFSSYEKAVEAPIRDLEAWRNGLVPEMSFDFARGPPREWLERTSMRSLASMYLRYHQGYVLLIRPVFFKLLGIVLGKDTDTSSLDGLINLSSQCLEAAKCNMRILIALSNRARLAKYGFYDSLHLFSALKIFSLSRLVNTVRPLGLLQDAEDFSLHSAAKDLLISMAACGNLASKGHVQMLEDIERLLDVVSQQTETETETLVDFGSEIFPWIDSIDSSGYFLDGASFA